MMDEQQVATPEEKARMNSREHLIRAALWAGFTHQEQLVALFSVGLRPWFNELSPLMPEERMLVMGQLCKVWYPEMTPDQERDAFRMLGQMYGVKKRKRMMRHAH
jgi:hypothetical protein